MIGQILIKIPIILLVPITVWNTIVLLKHYCIEVEMPNKGDDNARRNLGCIMGFFSSALTVGVGVYGLFHSFGLHTAILFRFAVLLFLSFALISKYEQKKDKHIPFTNFEKRIYYALTIIMCLILVFGAKELIDIENGRHILQQVDISDESIKLENFLNK